MLRSIGKVSLILLPLLVFVLFSCSNQNEKKEDKVVFVKKTPSGYQMFRNGEPFYIKGACGNSHFPALQNAGANTIRIYDTLNLNQILDDAHENGLAVIVDLPFPRYSKELSVYEDKNFIETHSKAIKQLVLKNKDHPALLFWMLGNEIMYPYVSGNRHFYTHFNGLIEMIHELDPNHPVSTALASFGGKRLTSVIIRSPNLDFISFNIFGALSSLEETKKMYTFGRDQPYFISEWGINGPWEETENLWGAPIEKTSADKAILVKNRYKKFIVNKRNCLGSAVFYWGTKQESTSTWFNIFTDKSEKTQLVFELENIWKNRELPYKGPTLNVISLDESSSNDNIFLTSQKTVSARISYEYSGNDSLNIRWDIKPENWFYKLWEDQHPVESINENMLQFNGSEMIFKVPEIEGAYRVYTYLTDKQNNVATGNIPFYVLNPPNELKN